MWEKHFLQYILSIFFLKDLCVGIVCIIVHHKCIMLSLVKCISLFFGTPYKQSSSIEISNWELFWRDQALDGHAWLPNYPLIIPPCFNWLVRGLSCEMMKDEGWVGCASQSRQSEERDSAFIFYFFGNSLSSLLCWDLGGERWKERNFEWPMRLNNCDHQLKKPET